MRRFLYFFICCFVFSNAFAGNYHWLSSANEDSLYKNGQLPIPAAPCPPDSAVPDTITCTIGVNTLTLIITGTNLKCNSDNSGTATVAVSGGVAPYTYDWSPSGQTTPTATGFNAGIKSVEVWDNTGVSSCIISINLQEPSPIFVGIIPPAPQTTCFGICDGAVTASPITDCPPVTYLWSNGDTNALADSLCAGTYTVTVTDAKGCTKTKTAVVGQPPILNHNGTSTNITCFGLCNGTACVAPSGGTMPYTYLWSPGGSTTSCLSALCPTPVLTCTVTDANGCVAVYSTSITQPPLLTVTVTGTNLLCNGVCTGSVTATASGGTAPYTYSWLPGGCTNDTCINLCADTYTLTLTDANGCTATATVTLTEPPVFTVSPTGTNISCFLFCDGTVSANPAGGVAPYTFAWSPGGCTTSSCSGLCPNTYSVTATDFNGCTATGTVTITEPPLLTLTVSATNVTCNGLCNGSVTATASGGTPPYTYSWSNSCSTSACTGLCAGTYSITLTDNNGCIATGTITVTQPAPLLPNLSMTPATCNGICDGTVTSSASGGTPPYTYLWAPGGCTTSTCTGLCPGTKTLTLTDANGCVSTGTITVTQPGTLTASISSATPNPLNCNGDCNGTAVVTVSGGTPTYTYLWSTGATTASVTGLCAGPLTVTVTDANGCTANTSVTFLQPTPLTVVVSASDPTCNGATNGTLCAIAGGGTPGYTFSWQPGSQTTSCITGLSAGTYTLTVTDSKGCTFTSIDTLVAPLTLNANTVVVNNASCAGICDGSATSTPSGGTSPYTFLWTGGQTTSTATGLCAGSFTVTVTDANGCTDIDIISITQPIVLSSSISSTTSSCTLCTGTATVSTSGGTSPYTFLWCDGQTTSAAVGLCIGNCSVTVTDANGCTNTLTATINPVVTLTVTVSNTSVSCFGSCDGIATANPAGGGAPYTYQWNAPIQTTQSATGLCAGTYTITVADINGCIATNTVSFTNPPVLTTTVSSTTASCGICNGTASVSSGGGTGSYTYSWNIFPVQTTSTATGLCAGTYSVTVNDANNCSTTNTVSVGSIPAISDNPSVTLATCGGADGAICVSPSGGTPGYTYVWSPGGATTACITGLSAGIDTVIITDAAGCSDTFAIGVGNIAGPTYTVSSQVNPTCTLSCNGFISISASSLFPPIDYLWNPGGQTTTSVAGLCAGTYIIQITDAVPCTTFASVTLSDPPQMSSNPSITNVTCNGGNNGSICLSPSGGISPYTFTWSNGQSTSCATGLTAGTYTVILADASGCDDTVLIPVTEPAALSVTLSSTNVTCNGACDGTATATISGGTPGYSSLWSTGAPIPTIVLLCPAVYSYTVTDANGCTATASVTITEPAVLTTTISSTNITCNSLCDGTAILTAAGGTLAYSYLWNPGGQTTSTATGLCSGNYQGTVTDANGCASSQTVNITEPAALSVTVTFTNASCSGGCDGTASASVGGGTGAYTYLWNPGGLTTSSVTGLCDGSSYTLDVSDANGCNTSSFFSISAPPVLQPNITNTSPLCASSCDGTATSSPIGGTPPYTFLWCNGQTTSTATGLCAGTCTLILSDANGCSDTTATLIIAPTPLTQGNGVAPATCMLCNGSITIAPAGGTPPYTYFWNTGATTPTITGLCAGVYIDTVMDANGCISVDTIGVSNSAGPVLTFTVTNVTCNGFCDGTATVIATGDGPPWIYSWFPTGQTTVTATGLCATPNPPAQYFATVTDTNGCVTVADTNISEPPPIVANPTITNATCFGQCDGSISTSATGGTGSLAYFWSPGMQTTTSITGQCNGNYTLTITDANGCVLTTTLTIGQNTILTSTVTSTNDSCNASCDGTATIVVSGGTLPYTYAWTGGQTTSTATGLCAGTFTITATDAIGCIYIDSAIITEPSVLASNISGINPLCNVSCDGSVSSAPTGGTPPYTYSWSPGGCTTSTCTGLCAGTYTLALSDANNCSVTNTFTLTDPAVLSSSVTVTNDSCNGDCNGTATVTVSGGTPPYAYLWCSGQTTTSVTGLCAGTCSLIITDANGCIKIDSAVITQPAALAVNISGTNPICNSSCDGTVSSAPTGGTLPYTFLWSNGCTTSPCTGLCAGIYSVTVTDANGCTALDTITLIDPVITTSFVITNDSCNGNCDGTAAVIVSGGASPYNYLWCNGATITSVTGLCAGTCTLLITDANGCTKIDSVVISQPNILVSNITAVNPLCTSLCNGSVASVPTGGTPPYTYSWMPGGCTTSSCTGLCAGTYTLTLSDANGCIAVNTIMLIDPPVLTATSTVTNASCLNTNDGNICITPSGGTPSYTYLWNTAQTDSCAAALIPGLYTVTVTDANGCTLTDTMTVGFITLVTANAGNDVSFCQGGNTMLCDTLSLNGITSIWYQLPVWNPVDTDSCTIVSPLMTTDYAVIVSNGICSDTDTVAVTIYSLPSVDAGTSVTILSTSSIGFNGTGSGNYLWSPAMGLSCTTCANPTANPSVTTTYTLSVTDANGCVNSDTVRVTIITDVIVHDGLSPNGDGINDVWEIPNIEQFPDALVEIYNRWGELLFHSIGYKEKWDCKYNGNDLPVGTYYYVINLNSDLHPEPITGPITILR